jgi:hypothetical protein
MEIRIESLKIQLDNHLESLLLELESFEKTLIRFIIFIWLQNFLVNFI